MTPVLELIQGSVIPRLYWQSDLCNDDELKEDGITYGQLQDKTPPQLLYASVYWANYLEVANIEDADLTNGLEMFVEEHMLHWCEFVDLIGELDSVHRATRVLKLLKSTSSDLYQLLSDTLRLIANAYGVIKRSALRIIQHCLFTPTDISKRQCTTTVGQSIGGCPCL
ncbi:hypothetical protein M378DRAFT_7879 [Amanita muscaria Koide BX008]|uniref:Uncharacterized protein n=1 Tax=Amanita muscaria (strain Koide BX008) TaxID=946122 RepID=A0A0C2X4J0_AMAMK|nr:hypothetical protein M378DRAFT_7879 [Amanita muscaria Koide BX008]